MQSLKYTKISQIPLEIPKNYANYRPAAPFSGLFQGNQIAITQKIGDQQFANNYGPSTATPNEK